MPIGVVELAHWSAATLDTREGRERQVAEPVIWPAAAVETLVSAADGLGLVSTPPPSSPAYDHTLIMGGTTTAHRLRTALARATSDAGVDLGAVIGVASSRPIYDWERARHGDVIDSEEWRDLGKVLTGEFESEPFPEPDNAAVDVTTTGKLGLQLRLLSAPATSAAQRATTADGLDFLVRQLRRPLGRVLVVTSAIYVPYTFFVAVGRLAEHGLDRLEVIGTPTSRDGPSRSLAQRFAQEINSTLQAIAEYCG